MIVNFNRLERMFNEFHVTSTVRTNNYRYVQGINFNKAYNMIFVFEFVFTIIVFDEYSKQNLLLFSNYVNFQ